MSNTPYNPFTAILATVAPPPTTEPGINEVMIRVVLKRELRTAGIPFHNDDSTEALATLQELYHLATATGRIF